MPGFGVQIRGLEEVQAMLQNVINSVQPAVAKAVQQGGYLVLSSAVQSIQHTSASGRVYTSHGVSHTASAPGEPPATDEGTLVGSLQIWTSSDGMSIAVGSNLNYAPYLEYGTRKMAARPYLNPAFDVNREEILALITKAVNQTMQG
jgi:HK97 gp10 family phage protein